jgi:hypothetical protein
MADLSIFFRGKRDYTPTLRKSGKAPCQRPLGRFCFTHDPSRRPDAELNTSIARARRYCHACPNSSSTLWRRIAPAVVLIDRTLICALLRYVRRLDVTRPRRASGERHRTISSVQRHGWRDISPGLVRAVSKS